MDAFALVRHYIDRMVQIQGHGSAYKGKDALNGSSSSSSNQMKVLVLDSVTTQIVSSVYSQTEILKQQVYLVTRLEELQRDASSNNNRHLEAVCFVRPIPANIDMLAQELARPRYAHYHIFFSAVVPPTLLNSLAEKDTHERVIQIQEYYADYCPLNEDLCTLHTRHSVPMTVAAGTSWAPKYATHYERTLQGLQGLLLSLKKQPTCIRYAGHSPCAEEIAKDLHETIQADDVFQFRRPTVGGLLVLILDRRDDPVTPLLSQWTYQAMVHELLGLNNHRVVLKGAPHVAKDLEEVVLSPLQDDFFRQNRYKNFGELGEAIQKLLQDYQKHTAKHNVSNLNTIEDMQNFMDQFPELRSRSHAVSKHVAIMGELARLVEVCHLLDVSHLEQELACADDPQAHWRELLEKLQNPQIKVPDKLRLGLLYALRYEQTSNLHTLQSAMTQGGVPPESVELVNIMLRYGGQQSRGPGLYGQNNNLIGKMTKSLITSVQGVQNVYAQHVPLLMDTLQSIAKGKLSLRTHPVVPGSLMRPQVEPSVPDEILVFMVGGVTYEEGTKVHELNHEMRGRLQVLLAGSTVHNSTSFLDELKATAL
jgi:vacuolar protein sorting-associated protein 45